MDNVALNLLKTLNIHDFNPFQFKFISDHVSNHNFLQKKILNVNKILEKVYTDEQLFNLKISNFFNLITNDILIKCINKYKHGEPLKLDFGILFCFLYKYYYNDIRIVENRILFHTRRPLSFFEVINNFYLMTKKVGLKSLDKFTKLQQLNLEINSNNLWHSISFNQLVLVTLELLTLNNTFKDLSFELLNFELNHTSMV